MLFRDRGRGKVAWCGTTVVCCVALCAIEGVHGQQAMAETAGQDNGKVGVWVGVLSSGGRTGVCS